VTENTPLATLLAAQSGYNIVRVHWLDPRLERERSRDGSCLNLSAAERNRKKFEEARVAYVDHANRTIICATHVYYALREALAKEAIR